MTRLRLMTVLVAGAIVAAGCTTSTEPTTVPPPPPTTQPAPVTTVAVSTTTTPQVTTTAPVDPWEIRVVPVNDYIAADVDLGIEEMITATAMIRATIVSIGEPGTGRWCCENPPLEVTDVDVIAGEFPEESDGMINGIDYQALDRNLETGDRVTMLMRDDKVALFVFGRDEGLVHPAPQHQADAIDAMRVREAQSAGGLDPADYSPLRAVADVWDRYRSSWWGPVGQRVALALSGVPGYPVVCSAADLGATLDNSDYLPASEGLPSTVARSRDGIVDTATACDYEGILNLTAFVDGDDTDLFWWRGPTLDTLIEADRRFGALRELVLAMTNTAVIPTTVTAANRSGDIVDQTFYVWPSAAVLLNDPRAGSAVSVLGEEEAARVANLADISVDELDELVSDFDGYALFRTAIDVGGNWRFAVTGD